MASKRRLRRKACEHKKPYPEDVAKRYAASMNHMYGGDITYYKCQWGNHFHVGHMPRKMRHAYHDRIRINKWG